jgi:folate-binding Fe-S cluster repair protein YgfZ
MRPVRGERGRMIDVCYLCERETKKEDDQLDSDRVRNAIDEIEQARDDTMS